MTQYFLQLKSFVEYGAAVTILLIIFSTIGNSVLALFGLNKNSDTTNLWLVTPVVGASITSLPLVILAQREIAISSRNVWVLIVFFLSPSIYVLVAQLRSRSLWESIQTIDWQRVIYFPIAAIVGLVPYLQLMVQPAFPLGFGTSATWQNNDLGAYIQMATNVGKSGIKDAGLINGWNAGLQASFDHPSAHSFFAAVARILNCQPFQIGIVLMATVLAMMLLAAVSVINQISHSAKRNSILIGSLVVINPPVVAALCNFFYPQLFSISIVIGYLGIALTIFRERQTFLGLLLLSLVTLSVSLISVEISVIMIPLVAVLALAINHDVSWKLIAAKVSTVQLCVYGVFFIFERDLFSSQFEVLTKISSSGVAGWNSNFVSPSMIFGFTPNQYSGPYSGGTRFFDALILIALLVVCIWKTLQNRNNIVLSSSIFLLIGIVCVAVSRWGIDGYQTWKLITSLTPLFMLLVMSILLVTKNFEKSVAAVAISMLSVGATFSWTGFVWNDAQTSSYINADVIAVTHSEIAKRQSGINILLAPYFETMAASVMSGVPSDLSSPTYQFTSGQELKFDCTLTTVDKISTLKNPGAIVRQQGKYLLIGTPKCR